MELKLASSSADFVIVRELFLEYQQDIHTDLCFQDFENELETLETMYSAPHGGLLLAFANDFPAACVAVRCIESRLCEMKRLYVRPDYRGTGLGRRLSVEIIALARLLGYKTMRLDTLPTMTTAQALYRSLGFKVIDPYRYNPDPAAVYMELSL